MKALILVDIQMDFCSPEGTLYVKGGEQIIPIANKLMQSDFFALRVLTQDNHPEDHKSFCCNHINKKPFDVINLNGIKQILWPEHCVEGLMGSLFESDILEYRANAIFRKGMDKNVDSYSGFFDNDGSPLGLESYLKERDITDVYVAGLALDVCVKYTALDATKLGFGTYLIEDGCRAVNMNPEDGTKAIKEMKTAGIKIVNSDKLIVRG